MSEINLTSLSINNMSGPPGLLLFFINPLGRKHSDNYNC